MSTKAKVCPKLGTNKSTSAINSLNTADIKSSSFQQHLNVNINTNISINSKYPSSCRFFPSSRLNPLNSVSIVYNQHIPFTQYTYGCPSTMQAITKLNSRIRANPWADYFCSTRTYDSIIALPSQSNTTAQPLLSIILIAILVFSLEDMHYYITHNKSNGSFCDS